MSLIEIRERNSRLRVEVLPHFVVSALAEYEKELGELLDSFVGRPATPALVHTIDNAVADFLASKFDMPALREVILRCAEIGPGRYELRAYPRVPQEELDARDPV